MTKQTKQKRVRISTTVAGHTQAVIVHVAKDVALPNQGVTLDYIVNDWVNLKRAAIEAATAPVVGHPSSVVGPQAA